MADIAFLGTDGLNEEEKHLLLDTLSGLGYLVSKCSLDSSDSSTRSLVFMEADRQFIFDNINPDDRVEVV